MEHDYSNYHLSNLYLKVFMTETFLSNYADDNNIYGNIKI